MADDPVVEQPTPDLAPVLADAPIVTVEPAPQPAPQPEPQTPTMVPLRVLQERVGEETTKRQTAEQRAIAAENRNKEFEQIVQRLQKPADPANPASVVERAPIAPAPIARPGDVDQNAIAIARQQLTLQSVSEAGIKAYGEKWDEAITALNAYDANTVDFVMGVVAVDQTKAHEIMFQLSKEPEKTLALAKMPLERRIAEITRMADKMPQTPAPEIKADPAVPAPKPAEPISRAPAPKPALAPLAPAPAVDPTTPEGNEKIEDKDWEKWWKTEGENKFMQRRSA